MLKFYLIIILHLFQYPDTQPEFPLSIFKYFVTFNYVEDKDYDEEIANTPRQNSSNKSKTCITNELNQINYRGNFC